MAGGLPSSQTSIGNVASITVPMIRKVIDTPSKIHRARGLPNLVDVAAKNKTNAKSTVRMV